MFGYYDKCEQCEAKDKQIEKLKKALEEMHKVLVGRNDEPHLTLASNPVQNGCLVYSEWRLREIKEQALKELNGETK